MRIGPLQRASDDDVHLLPGNPGKRLVKIEIIAGHKAVTDTVYVEYIWRLEGITIRYIQSDTALLIPFDLGGCWMSLKIFANDLACWSNRIGCVPVSLLRLERRIDKYQRLASGSRLHHLFHEGIMMALHSLFVLPFILHFPWNIAVFGQHNQVHAGIALIQQVDECQKALILTVVIHGIPGLNHCGFHETDPLLYGIFISFYHGQLPCAMDSFRV